MAMSALNPVLKPISFNDDPPHTAENQRGALAKCCYDEHVHNKADIAAARPSGGASERAAREQSADNSETTGAGTLLLCDSPLYGRTDGVTRRPESLLASVPLHCGIYVYVYSHFLMVVSTALRDIV